MIAANVLEAAVLSLLQGVARGEGVEQKTLKQEF
jgi:hypothetical protein